MLPFGPFLAVNAMQADRIERIIDPQIRAGVTAAVNLNLLPAADERVYPGHFCINADGGGFGSETTWPGLDSWQMAGGYLLLGKTRLVEDYFDFVTASQRKDGNIPFAIFPGSVHGDNSYLRGMKWPEDQFTYVPPKRDDLPSGSQETRQWVGLFRHWELKSNPLSTLGPICYLLSAFEIYQATSDLKWLDKHLAAVEAAGNYLHGQIAANGLLSGSGFYTERPPRDGWDGVTQCYAVEAFHDLGALTKAAGHDNRAWMWRGVADKLAKKFSDTFWVGNHFAEYVHATRGLVDSHGLSDTNWAAIAFGVATRSQTKVLWPKLLAEPAFWPGGMPTLTVTKPFSYASWEDEDVPFAAMSETNDVAAMGRVWYLEALACKRMRAWDRLIESARQVAQAAEGGYWRERYHPKPEGGVTADGSLKYCEYPAILIRVVLGNPKVLMR